MKEITTTGSSVNAKNPIEINDSQDCNGLVDQTKANENIQLDNSTHHMVTQNDPLKKMKTSTTMSAHSQHKTELMQGEINNY